MKFIEKFRRAIGLCRKEKNPLFHFENYNVDTTVYKMVIYLKSQNLNITYYFDDYDTANKVKESVSNEIVKDAKVISYIHAGKNAIDLYTEILYPKVGERKHICPIYELYSVSVCVNDISHVDLYSIKDTFWKRKIITSFTEKEFDDKVAAWHNDPGKSELYEYLGLTKEEFDHIAEHKFDIIWKK